MPEDHSTLLPKVISVPDTVATSASPGPLPPSLLIITTLLALLSIFFFGGEILKGFSLAMIFGIIFGTYSSIYIANTVLVRLKVTQKTVLRDDKN